jgi:hypothetical protein
MGTTVEKLSKVVLVNSEDSVERFRPFHGNAKDLRLALKNSTEGEK